jgi:hypothetical protein
MRRRVCYVHIGPHKTGTSSIQWFLQQNRAELLKHGYFVPESATVHGAHHSLGRKLCGQTLPQHAELAAIEFARHLARTRADAVIISSETLEGLLRHAACARTFFNRIGELNLAPKLVLFPRNQPQAMNSRYAEAIRGFSLSTAFESFARESARRPSFRYLPLLELAEAFNAELIARPFTGEIVVRDVVAEFLGAIGLDPSQFENTDVRHNPSVGPFTVSVARHVSRAINPSGKLLKWRQATRCKQELANYLQETRLADNGYCGLTTALARETEATYQAENSAFAQRVWDAHWEDIFEDDLHQEFTPNDLDMCAPNESTKQLLGRVVRDMIIIAEEIMRDPLLAVEAPWNDLCQRAGWISQIRTGEATSARDGGGASLQVRGQPFWLSDRSRS